MSLEVETINPIFVNNNINSMISAIRSGQLDPKTEVLKKLNSLTPVQRQSFKQSLPVLQRIAQATGINAAPLNQLTDQL